MPVAILISLAMVFTQVSGLQLFRYISLFSLAPFRFNGILANNNDGKNFSISQHATHTSRKHHVRVVEWPRQSQFIWSLNTTIRWTIWQEMRQNWIAISSSIKVYGPELRYMDAFAKLHLIKLSSMQSNYEFSSLNRRHTSVSTQTVVVGCCSAIGAGKKRIFPFSLALPVSRQNRICSCRSSTREKIELKHNFFHLFGVCVCALR